ncbi:MAG: hypothetical protein WBN04_19290 [Paracoccaceae bacterium]
MAPEDFIDDPYLGKDELEQEPEYEDGFGDHSFLGEADYASRPKRHEKTRRAALRVQNPKITRPSKHQPKHDRRQRRRMLAQRLAAQRAQDLWNRRVRKLMIDLWPRHHSTPLNSWLIAIMFREFVQRAVQIASRKIDGPMGLGDVISIGVRAMIASAATAAAQKSGTVRPEREEAYTLEVFEKLGLAEKIIKLILKVGGSGESESWENGETDGWDAEDATGESWESAAWEAEADAFGELEDLAESSAAAWEDESADEMTQPPRRNRPQPKRLAPANQRRECAHALRQAARYLLRLERRLGQPGGQR